MIGAAAVVLAALFPAAAAADPLAELKASCETRQSTDAPPATRVSYRICSGTVASFDGTPLDVTVSLPARRPRRALPLVVFLHGFIHSKREYLSDTREGTGPDRGGEAYKTVRWNNVWFASRGYAVLNYSARGHGDSGGSVDLASKHTEVRDTHHLTGLLADDSRARDRLVQIHPHRVAALGGSYGGGQTWLLLTTRGRGARQYGSWVSPGGRGVRLAAAVPQFTWTDLLSSLAPNGKGTSSPLGIAKITIIDALVATANTKVPPQVLAWIARLNAGEPYDSPNDPLIPEARRAVEQDRSALRQEEFFRALRGRRQRSVPVLAAQGWTDPIFPASESVRMYERLNAARRRYPVQLYFGDFEHLTAAVKIPDLAYYHRLGNRMLDRYLRRRGKPIRFDVRSARTRCEKERFGPVTRARRWTALGPRRLAFELAGPQQVVSPLTDPRAVASDPVAVSTQSGRGCVTTTLGPSPGVATWTVGLPRRSFALIGMPRLTLRYRALAPDVQLNARLWDVAPDGTQTLVTRGAYRAVAPDPAGEVAEYQLFGNHWRFEPGHRLMLEVTADDSPYLRRNNFPAAVTIDSARIVLPGRR